MIEEGRARLDGGGHRHAVGLDKQVAGKISVQIGVEGLIEERAIGGVKLLGEQRLRVIRT